MGEPCFPECSGLTEHGVLAYVPSARAFSLTLEGKGRNYDTSREVVCGRVKENHSLGVSTCIHMRSDN